MNKNFHSIALSITLCALVAPSVYAHHYNDSASETLYTLSNTEQNSVYAYQIDEWGNVISNRQFSTGGKGTGAGLGNQGALALSEDKKYLFAINAASNDISVFRIKHGELILLDHVAEQGLTPVSLSVKDDLVYVVNSGDDSIFGYRFDRKKSKLHGLPDSYRKLATTGAKAAEISFDKDGDNLVVTEKANNKITNFVLNDAGLPVKSVTVDSAGQTPFGFAFGRGGRFYVSEAQGGAINGATASAYQLKRDGNIELINGAVAINQTAACWLATTPNSRLAFTADTPANSISSFKIDRDGKLSLLNTQAATPNKPSELVVSDDGALLYSLNNGDHTITIYGIERNGDLQNLTTISSLPAGLTGLAVVQNPE